MCRCPTPCVRSSSGCSRRGPARLRSRPPARADAVTPQSAAAFRDSVGVVTHIVYYDTAYGELAADRRPARRAGRAAPARRRLRQPVAAVARLERALLPGGGAGRRRGMRFTFGMGRPGDGGGTIDDRIRVLSGRLRHAAEALEAPNEFDKYVGGPKWPSVLSRLRPRALPQGQGQPALRSLPVLGPSFATPRRSGAASATSAPGWTSATSIPTRAGSRPTRAHPHRAGARQRHRRQPQAGVGHRGRLPQRPARDGRASRRCPSAPAAVYLLRTFLEHFRSGIAPHLRLRADRREARAAPARRRAALRPAASRLLAQAGLHGAAATCWRWSATRPGRRRRLRPLRLSPRRRAVRRLVLQKADGSYIVALWRHASVWDREARRAVRATPTTVRVSLPGVSQVTAADPVAGERRRVALRRGSASLQLGGSPLLLEVGGRSRPR